MRSIDIEDTIREILSEKYTAYCRPLPKDFDTPSLLVTMTGGTSDAEWSGIGQIDHFTVSLDARAETEAETNDLLRGAIALLETKIYTQINSQGSWGQDPARPDLAMCTATLTVTVHREEI